MTWLDLTWLIVAALHIRGIIIGQSVLRCIWCVTIVCILVSIEWRLKRQLEGEGWFLPASSASAHMSIRCTRRSWVYWISEISWRSPPKFQCQKDVWLRGFQTLFLDSTTSSPEACWRLEDWGCAVFICSHLLIHKSANAIDYTAIIHWNEQWYIRVCAPLFQLKLHTPLLLLRNGVEAGARAAER